MLKVTATIIKTKLRYYRVIECVFLRLPETSKFNKLTMLWNVNIQE